MAVPDQLALARVPPDRPRRWLSWDLALVAATGLLPLCAAAAEAPGTVTAWLTLPVLLTVQWFVMRRGGWRLIGPHCHYDLIRMARKGRTVVFRVLFLVALLVGIWYANAKDYPANNRGFVLGPDLVGNIIIGDNDGDMGQPRLRRDLAGSRNRMARFNTECVYTWFLLQNLTILLLTPAYVGGAIAEERERGTLDLLLTSALYNREIVLGKFAARLLHLGSFMLAGLPVFSLMLVWGGIDMHLLLANWLHSVVLLLSVGSACLLLSTMQFRATTCVIVCYVLMLPLGLCCMGLWQDAWTQGLGTADLGFFVLAVGHGIFIPSCVLLAIQALRPPDWPVAAGPLLLRVAETRAAQPVSPMPPYLSVSTAADPWEPTLPPVTENALLWKECHTGGRALLKVPEVLLVGGSLMAWVLMAMVFMTIDECVKAEPHTLTDIQRVLTRVGDRLLRVLYGCCVACFAIGVAFRATASVVRERQRQTLDMLLMIPVDRGEILRAKWLGALLKDRLWLALLAGDVLVGLVIGVYHPFSVFYLLLSPWPLVLCLCSLGVLVSVITRTGLQANLVMAGGLLGLVVLIGSTQPGLFLGFNSLTQTWWDREPILDDEPAAATVSAIAFLLAAAMAWRMATVLFARTERH